MLLLPTRRKKRARVEHMCSFKPRNALEWSQHLGFPASQFQHIRVVTREQSGTSWKPVDHSCFRVQIHHEVSPSIRCEGRNVRPDATTWTDAGTDERRPAAACQAVPPPRGWGWRMTLRLRWGSGSDGRGGSGVSGGNHDTQVTRVVISIPSHYPRTAATCPASRVNSRSRRF